MAKKVLTHNLSEPLSGATTARIDIDMVDGNLTIDKLTIGELLTIGEVPTSGEPVLASGTLQYLENQGLPIRSLRTSNGQAALTLKASSGKGQPWIRFPWAACNGATLWQIHLNPTVSFVITAHSGGGNIKLDLAGMVVTHVTADTGGGNIEVILPDNLNCLNVSARSGAGNVVVQVPGGLAARIHATSGLGKVIVEPRFIKIDGNTYQSPDFERAADKVEITLNSGAGNVCVEERIVQLEAAAIRN